MRIDILTIFPEIFAPLFSSIIKRAQNSGLVKIYIHNLRDYTGDLHRTVDDAPYGGGSGMVMKPDILYKAVMALKDLNPGAPVIFMSPQGKVFSQSKAREFSSLSGMILVCAHYEGVDERFVELACDEEISIGDYVLTGGELPAMVVSDAVIRLLPGAIDESSASEDSFTGTFLDYPHYTRPYEFMGKKVPDVLLSGDHAKIKKWRQQQQIVATYHKRPDLMVGMMTDKNILRIINNIEQ